MIALGSYVTDRDSALASVRAAGESAGVEVGRVEAKKLFLNILFGGSSTTWFRQLGADAIPLPKLVYDLVQDAEKCRAADKARCDSCKTPRFQGEDEKTIQYLLNAEEERRVIELAWGRLKVLGAVLECPEHDGLAFNYECLDLEALEKDVFSYCGYDVTIKRSPGVQEALGVLCKLSGCDPCLDRVSRLEDEFLVRRARKEALSSHELFAKVVLSMSKVSDEVPWPLNELYRVTHAGALVWFSPPTCVWSDAGPKTGS